MELTRQDVCFHVDYPESWADLPRCTIVRGWCFDRRGLPLRGVRLTSPTQVFLGTLGLPRPDVLAAAPNAPHASTGFEIRIALAGGPVRVRLEVRLSSGEWRTLVATTARPPRRLPLWLGGGGWEELLQNQTPLHGKYPPVAPSPDVYPPLGSGPRPRLVIVTPSFQQARFIRDTLDGVVDQTAVDCAYVVQDGGSKDGTRDIIERYAPRLHAWASAPDGGQADAICTGFARVPGRPDDVMGWINSDDYYLPGALAYVADYFARHPGTDAIYAHRIVVDESTREIGRWHLPPHDDEVIQLCDFVPQETLFWRRRLWERVGGLDRTFQFAMDWDLLLRFIAARARIVRVPHFLACFRVHPEQKTSAQMRSRGQWEIDRLRARTFGREFPSAELVNHPRLRAYLRRSAWIEALWRWGVRAA